MGDAAASAERHLAECPGCQREAEGLRRVKDLLQRSLRSAAVSAEPDWTGFWPTVLRGIEDARRVPVPARRPLWREPRWAVSGALLAALLGSVTLWQATQAPPAPEDPVIVSSADTDHPDGSVMVYHTPERDMAVVWVFGVDE